MNPCLRLCLPQVKMFRGCSNMPSYFHVATSGFSRMRLSPPPPPPPPSHPLFSCPALVGSVERAAGAYGSASWARMESYAGSRLSIARRPPLPLPSAPLLPRSRPPNISRRLVARRSLRPNQRAGAMREAARVVPRSPPPPRLCGSGRRRGCQDSDLELQGRGRRSGRRQRRMRQAERERLQRRNRCCRTLSGETVACCVKRTEGRGSRSWSPETACPSRESGKDGSAVGGTRIQRRRRCWGKQSSCLK